MILNSVSTLINVCISNFNLFKFLNIIYIEYKTRHLNRLIPPMCLLSAYVGSHYVS